MEVHLGEANYFCETADMHSMGRRHMLGYFLSAGFAGNEIILLRFDEGWTGGDLFLLPIKINIYVCCL